MNYNLSNYRQPSNEMKSKLVSYGIFRERTDNFVVSWYDSEMRNPLLYPMNSDTW
jgi:hypothetical protein